LILRYHFFLSIFLLLSEISCRSSKEYPADFKGDQIHFGQGGGFSGIVTHYVLLEDGRLFQKAYRDSSFTFLTNWSSDFVKQMFSNYHLLQLDKIEMYEPGDLYYFIEYHTGDKDIHRVTWGRPGTKPDDNIVIFYNLLYRSTKSKL